MCTYSIKTPKFCTHFVTKKNKHIIDTIIALLMVIINCNFEKISKITLFFLIMSGVISVAYKLLSTSTLMIFKHNTSIYDDLQALSFILFFLRILDYYYITPADLLRCVLI